MKYLIITFIVINIAAIIIIPLFWFYNRRRLKLSFLQSQLMNNINEQRLKYADNSFFSSKTVALCAKHLFDLQNDKAQKFLSDIKDGNWMSFCDYLYIKDFKSALALQALFDLETACSVWQINIYDRNSDAFMAYIAGKRRKGIVNRIRHLFMSPFDKAFYECLSAEYAIFQGDFSQAADKLQHAVKLLNKTKNLQEKAQTIFRLAEVSAYCGFNDNAYILYYEARKIFQLIDDKSGFLYSTLGVAKSSASYNSETCHDELFKLCLKEFSKLNDIKGQILSLKNLSLCEIAKEKYASAKKNICKAMNLNKTLQNKRYEAELLNVSTYIAFKTKKYKEGLASADQAIKIYRHFRNGPEILNMLYLKSSMLYLTGDCNKAKKYCRQIIKSYNSFHAFFSKAQALSLMSNICYRQKLYKQAITYGELSLAEELAQKNYVDALADYHNLMLAAKKLKNKKAYDKYHNQAQMLIDKINSAEKS